MFEVKKYPLQKPFIIIIIILLRSSTIKHSPLPHGKWEAATNSEWEKYIETDLNACTPNQQRTLNKPPTELRRGNFVNKHRLGIQIGAKRAKKNVYAMSAYSDWASILHTIVVGWADGKREGRVDGWSRKGTINLVNVTQKTLLQMRSSYQKKKVPYPSPPPQPPLVSFEPNNGRSFSLCLD